jgi:hypothetical protein
MTKDFVGYIDILNKDQCESVLNVVDSLRKQWLNISSTSDEGERGYPPLWTLGAASYRDGRNNLKKYHKIKIRENKTLIENFSGLYDILISKLEPCIGSVDLEYDLALPGFHIFGERGQVKEEDTLNIPKNILSMVHKDELNKMHYDFLASKYYKVDRNSVLSVTLSISLPQLGSGLCVWGDELERFSTVEGFARDVLDSEIYDNFNLGKPKVIPYREGSAFCFSGISYHHISPIKKVYPGDRRVTLQAHGIICDGAWRLFF